MVARTQTEHALINSREYPGTRQICVICDQPTGLCEDDEIYTDAGKGPLCFDCYKMEAENDKA